MNSAPRGGAEPQRVALIAFGCSPEGGSERRAGWQWATSLAEAGVGLTVFAHAEQRGSVDGIDGVQFEWVEASAPKIADLRPSYRSSLAYLAFLKACETPLQRMHAADPFRAGVHVSWSQIRSGTPLAAVKKLPYIFGPVGGGQRMPVELALRHLGKGTPAELARNAHVLSTRFNRKARRSCERASLVVASNPETARLARVLGAGDVAVRPDGGLTDLACEPAPLPPFDDGLRLLWVGRLMPRKGLGLALDAVAMAREQCDVRLTVLGDGGDRTLLKSGIDGVEWRGQVPPSELPGIFAEHHINLFTSLRESGAPPVIEAMGFGRPTVCLDQHGPATIVDSSNGVLVDPAAKGLTKRLAGVLVDLASAPGVVAELAAGTYAQREALRQVNRTAWMIEQLDRVS